MRFPNEFQMMASPHKSPKAAHLFRIGSAASSAWGDQYPPLGVHVPRVSPWLMSNIAWNDHSSFFRVLWWRGGTTGYWKISLWCESTRLFKLQIQLWGNARLLELAGEGASGGMWLGVDQDWEKRRYSNPQKNGNRGESEMMLNQGKWLAAVFFGDLSCLIEVMFFSEVGASAFFSNLVCLTPNMWPHFAIVPLISVVTSLIRILLFGVPPLANLSISVIVGYFTFNNIRYSWLLHFQQIWTLFGNL